LQENVARLGNRELAVELVGPDAPKTRGLTPAVRKYIEKLIQSRRVEIPKQNERNNLWKQNLNQTVPRHQAPGQRM